MIDDVIDPRETRATICRALEMAAEQADRAAVEATRSGAGMSLDDPSSSPARSRARSPTASSARRSRTRRRSTPPRRGGSSTRAASTSTSTRARPTARRATRSRTSSRSRDAIRAEVGDAVIINFSTGTIGVPVEKRIAYLRGVPAGGRGAEHGLDELRQVLAQAQGLRVQVRVREPVRRDHRAARGDATSSASSPSTSASTSATSARSRRWSTWALLEAPLHVDFVMGVVGGDPADRAQPRRDGRQHARRAATTGA